uniref:Dorsal protein n=1 Tax=Parasteatoda tepidariorum TaxID=114398 RepID=A0A2Z6DTK9_PARTP|nr:dorsal protein [Parasteatoda tepidariorum]
MFSSIDTLSFNLPSQPVERSFCRNLGLTGEFQEINSTRSSRAFVEVLEQPVSIGARFRYKCEGRSAGCIRGVNSTDKQKTYPTIKVHGYQGAASVVVSCVTKDGPPYFPHPHNLVGKTCANGVCYKTINSPDMVCSFANLGIQCVKKKDIKESLSHREAIQVDPFGTGFSHHLEPGKINLNCLRLCFQVFLPNETGKMCIPLPPVVSNAIYDNKTVSDLTITKLSHSSAPVTGGQEVILLCDQVNKDDIQILFYEEVNNKIIWCANGKFAPHHVHRKAAISFQTPAYRDVTVPQGVDCFVQLRRPSDGAVGKPRTFCFIPLKQDPEGLARKRNKFEALRLSQILQPSNLPSSSNNAEPLATPRVIKQAVRSKISPTNGMVNNFTSNIVSSTNYQLNSTLSGSDFKQKRCVQMLSQEKCHISESRSTHNTALLESRQKVDDILAIAKDQVGIGNSHFFDSQSDDNLDKLSSLDIGMDPCDMDVNLSNITLDSFSDASSLNLSAALMDTKN